MVMNGTRPLDLGYVTARFKITETDSPIYSIALVNRYTGHVSTTHHGQATLSLYNPKKQLIRPLNLGEFFYTVSGNLLKVDGIIQSEKLIFYKSDANPFLSFHEKDLDIFETNKLLIQPTDYKRISHAPHMPEL